MEYFKFTLAIDPVRFQVMLLVEPTIHVSAPLGAVSVKDPFI